MATFDEAFLAATKQLDERGQLLNFELSRIVDRDEGLLREIRETLIFKGVAEDRFGVGLVRANHSRSVGFQPTILNGPEDGRVYAYPTGSDGTLEESPSSEEITFQSIEEADEEGWALMTNGVTRGPFTLETIRLMLQRGEIGQFDVVRAGDRGVWQRPVDVDCLKNHNPSNGGSIAKESNPLPLRMPDQIKSKKESVKTAKPASVTTTNSTAAIKSTERVQIGKAGDVEYFLWEGGISVGPVSRSELRMRVTSGRVNADEMVQVGSEGDWQPVSNALGMPRTPLNIPRTKDAATLNTSEIVEPRQVSPSIANDRFSPRVGKKTTTRQTLSRSTPESRTSQTRSVTPSTKNSFSSVSGIWYQAAAIVGGSRRLGIIVVLSSAVVVVILYLRQPPSSQKIYAEVQSSYEKLAKIRSSTSASPGIGTLPKQLAEETSRIRVFRDLLKQRASAARRVDQELFWACEYGLLPMLEHPNSDEFDEIFSGHMSRVALELSPSSASTVLATEIPAQVRPPELNRVK